MRKSKKMHQGTPKMVSKQMGLQLCHGCNPERIRAESSNVL